MLAINLLVVHWCALTLMLSMAMAMAMESHSGSAKTDTTDKTAPRNTRPKATHLRRPGLSPSSHDTIDMILNYETANEDQRFRRISELSSLLGAKRDQILAQYKTSVIDSFGVPDAIGERLQRFCFQQLLVLQRKTPHPTVYDVKQALGFLTDNDIVNALEDYCIRTRLRYQVCALCSSAGIDPPTDSVLSRWSIGTLAAARDLFSHHRSGRDALTAALQRITATADSGDHSLSPEVYRQLRDEVAGSRPVSIWVFTAVALVAVSLAFSFCIRDINTAITAVEVGL